jgi:hypothetical protein
MIKVMHRGIEIHCDTPEEAAAIAERLAGSVSARPEDTGGPGVSGGGSRWTVSRFNSFMAQLRDQQRKLLRSLVNSPDGQTDTALRQHLGLSSNKAFGPILTGISRRAKKAGVGLTDVLVSERITVGNERVLEFKATPAFASIAREAGGIK